MASLVLALVPLQLDGLVAATALPEIAGSLGGFDRIAWVTTAYLLTMAIGTITSGRLGDMFGRRPLLLAALGVFFAGSALAGAAGSMGALVGARGLQGLGAGMTFTTLMAVIADVVPPDRRARYQSLVGAVAPFSMILGPWVGGVITEHLGWRWIFWLNLPLIALSVVGVLLWLRLPTRPSGGRVDVAGLVALTVASTGVVLAVTWGGHEYAWLSGHVLGAAFVGLAGIVAVLVVEARAEQPVLPLDLFRNRAVVSSFAVLFLAMGAVMMAALNFVPLFLQVVQGRSASSSGLLLLPMLLPSIGVALATGAWTSKGSRFRPVMIAGTGLLTLACAGMATVGTGSSTWVTAGCMVAVGAGIGLLFQTPIVLVQNSAPAAEVGAATGAGTFMRTIGGAIGVGALGALFASSFASSLDGAALPDGADASSLTPDALAGLSTAAHAAVVGAVTDGTTALFWGAAVAAALAWVAALAVPRQRARARESPGPRQRDPGSRRAAVRRRRAAGPRRAPRSAPR